MHPSLLIPLTLSPLPLLPSLPPRTILTLPSRSCFHPSLQRPTPLFTPLSLTPYNRYSSQLCPLSLPPQTRIPPILIPLIPLFLHRPSSHHFLTPAPLPTHPQPVNYLPFPLFIPPSSPYYADFLSLFPSLLTSFLFPVPSACTLPVPLFLFLFLLSSHCLPLPLLLL